eukprot:CAMPEP_0198124484 /NCGR_PEP_ID=MMETSP1442-20131203/39989_1 /TAXON_ID= /ORGANISM="Craspedostauros australis, Strain CCMP3328" /LENGTH=140 /DNA_ID=CAMNT_0043783883 /DNA_START=138 /DNA_END=560 /DNA_ORIENTATION=-
MRAIICLFAWIAHTSSFVIRSTALHACRITQPSPDDAADMGMREWPQQVQSGTWQESCADGDVLTRYVLDGTGTLRVDGEAAQTVAPGTLVEVTDAAQLVWEASSDEMILLTPSFEEGGKLIFVALGLLVLSVALIVGTS